MPKLDRRIEALEAMNASDEGETLVIRFVASGRDSGPLRALSAGGMSWQPMPNESEDDFVDRVSALVPVKPNCVRVLIEA